MAGKSLSPGDVVRLKQPYRPLPWLGQKPSDWVGFEFGIVAELGGENAVSLFLYDSTGQLLVMPALATQALLVPTYFDCTVDEVVQYEIVAESIY